MSPETLPEKFQRIRRHDMRRALVAYVILALALGVAFAIQRANDRGRRADIQASRVSSCQMTYEGVREVFRPFFPVHRTAKQERDVKRFNATINRLKRRCVEQTK